MSRWSRYTVLAILLYVFGGGAACSFFGAGGDTGTRAPR